jgi:hypothetical protein
MTDKTPGGVPLPGGGDKYDSLIVDMTESLWEVIDNYTFGHNVPAAVVMGVLFGMASTVAYREQVNIEEDEDGDAE